jgi:hypothetical protein
MQVDIAHVPECPNLSLASSRVRQALEQLGRAATVREIEVTSEEAARALGMPGSPTILLDGRDPFASGAAPSLSCRLYPTASGVQGAPSVADLVKVLSDEGETDHAGGG